MNKSATLPEEAGAGAIPAPDAAIASDVRIIAVLSQFGVMQLVLALTAVIRNKVVAFRLGPAAFGEYSQIASVISVITAVVSFGMGVSLSRNAAKARSNPERQRQLANANGIVLTLAIVAVTVAIALLLSGRLLPLVGLAHSTALMGATAIFIMAIPFEGLKNNYLALLQGILDVRGLAAGRSIGVLLATMLAVPIVWVLGFLGAGIQFLLLSALLALLLGLRCRQVGYAPLSVRLESPVLLQLASFGLVSLGASFASVFVDTAVRGTLIESAGAAANGLLQAPYMLSQTVKAMVTASISSIALATIAPRDKREEIAAAVDKLLGVVIPVGASSIGLLGLLGAPVLALLYSGAFVPGASLFRYVLVADLIHVFVWVIGANLLARGDRLLWLGLDLVQAGVRWTVAIALVPRFGATAVAIGYLAAVLLHLALNLLVYRLYYQIPLGRVHLSRLFVAAALVVALSLVGQHAPSPVPLFAAGLTAWAGYTAYHARRTGLLQALRERLRR